MSNMWKPCLLLVCLATAGCASKSPDVTGSDQQLAIRQIQSREYDTLDRDMTLRSVVATLQDLDFTIDNADAAIGTVTATRLYQHKRYETYVMRMTVTVRERDGERMVVRANARLNDEAVDKAKTYQDFFSALDKSIFLTQHQVD